MTTDLTPAPDSGPQADELTTLDTLTDPIAVSTTGSTGAVLGTGASTAPTGPVAPAEDTARSRLAGRVLVVAGNLEQHKYPAIILAAAHSLDSTGLVICGNEWTTTMRRARHANADMFLMYDPVEACKQFASKDDPFPLGETPEDQGVLFDKPTLEARLQGQIAAGASVAVTPTGYVRAGDQLALRAVITAANKLTRTDMVVLLPLDYKWLTGPALKTLIGVINRSKHPVAITLGDSSTDPLSHPGVLAGARTLAGLDKPPMFHKTDLAGLDMMAHGALATSIGVIASKRRAPIPGTSAWAPRTRRGATVLLPELLRFRRTLDMTDQWYASKKAPDCGCQVCEGQPIDRFTSEEYDCVIAAQHNGLGIIGFTNEAAAAGGYRTYWVDKVNDAVAAHEALSQYVGSQIDPPKEVTAWQRGLSGTPTAPQAP